MNENARFSDLNVMKFAAGYYLGREITGEDGIPMPYDRKSDYFEHVRDAEKALEEMINKRKGKRLDLLQLVPFTQSRKKRAFFLA